MATSFLPSILAYTTFLPSILVPVTGLVFPAVVFAFSLLYIERDDIG